MTKRFLHRLFQCDECSFITVAAVIVTASAMSSPGCGFCSAELPRGRGLWSVCNADNPVSIDWDSPAGCWLLVIATVMMPCLVFASAR